MDQMSIVYITDLEIGQFSSKEELDSLFSKILELDPDIFLFGGDLFWSDAQISDEDREMIVSQLSSIKAPLGKFAVYGEQDLVSPERKELVNSIYHDSEIEVLENSMVSIANQDRSPIQLAGLSIDPDVQAACGSFNPEQFNLLLSHYPDNLLDPALAVLPVSYAIAGNAHGTQITWPIKGGYRDYPGSTQLNRAHDRDLTFPFWLSSGTGCINFHARLNSPVEIVYYMINAA